MERDETMRAVVCSHDAKSPLAQVLEEDLRACGLSVDRNVGATSPRFSFFVCSPKDTRRVEFCEELGVRVGTNASTFFCTDTPPYCACLPERLLSDDERSALRTEILARLGRMPEAQENEATEELFFFGVPECDKADIPDLGEGYAVHTQSLGEKYWVRVRAWAATDDEARARVVRGAERVRARFAAAYVPAPTLEAYVVQALLRQKKTLATAESCTGGLIAKRITDQAGSSEIFGFGFVTYANAAKHALLGVQEETLARFGAVSPETAREMALGALRVSGADYALAVTGIAGPGGGTPEKPVGLVYVALAYGADTVVLRKLTPIPDCTSRAAIRDRTACHAFDMLRCALGTQSTADSASGS